MASCAGSCRWCERASGPLRALRFAGARYGDWFGPACRPEDEAAMAADCAELLSAERSEWHLLELDRIESGGSWPEALWAGGGGRIAAARRRRVDVYPFIEFDDGGYEGYLAGRSAKLRGEVGRRRRKLERERGLSFRMTWAEEEVGPDLETFLRLHDERWAGRGGSAATLAPEFGEIHRRFAVAAHARGWLRLWVAEVDDGPGACWYGWRLGRRYCHALSGLRQDCERLGLGTVLLLHTIEQAAAEGAPVYDMMRGDEPYKRRFETGRREAGTWSLGRRRHPIALARAGADRVAAGARGLPAPLRSPLKRAYRRVAGR